MKYDTLTDEQMAQIEGKTAEEILEFAKEEGLELSEDELDEVAGGNMWIADTEKFDCPHCHVIINVAVQKGKTEYTCTVCHRKFHYVPHTV